MIEFTNGNDRAAGVIGKVVPPESTEGGDFIARFCNKFSCREKQYEKRFLCECVYPEARGMARLIWIFRPGFFKAELELIEQLRHAPSFDEVKRLIYFFEARYAPVSFFSVVFKVRLSARRLLDTAQSVFTQAES